MSQQLQQMYRTEHQVRAGFGGDEQKATQYFADYLDFVLRCAGTTQGKLLDIGCGAGWSSFSFARAGYETTGIDLNASAFEPPLSDHLTLREASVLQMPFEDASFDIVTSYQTLEHVPKPRLGLLEMLRVCKPGGTLCVVGPNCLSLLQNARSIYYVLQNRPLKTVFVRTPEMPRHPYGNTLPEILAFLPLTAARLLRKKLAPRAVFSMRRPDLRPPFHADNDACYLCNPTDLTRFFSAHDCRIVRNGAFGRPTWSADLVGGTWVAARKGRGGSSQCRNRAAC